ncbi:MAG: UDP-N-acetylmuramoyl-L-alanyl-D-glutamate-2,6-diaminopimelate ligase [Candidatus Giovannonibacteria bacterium GW2011_GWA2_53_7]|uniref:UDP-N-acetylmuramoyl-L-alanyl-D-glutamate-2, 6-diaminopimelate ligase n=1 Tax=Candidatus Giovannonibacteria bacterium GW2011_GWA2_53_7 TaxID=1618650 RepID=A0A0G1XWL2_9BACT|nr:MAG: UDP-N-acetylmuramoyl-L-alanyl-D-glutamate-2,6-diaminopimelate ligase [Candidatus Giovannonibacteria bacterium GW2011_GWA2_53_7]
MVKAGCKYAVLEASSEGLDQGRLNGVPVQVAVFTNLTPEHIESHGSFEAYARAKEKLFAKLSEPKRGAGHSTALIVNLDDPNAQRFLKYPADHKVGCTLVGQPAPDSSMS